MAQQSTTEGVESHLLPSITLQAVPDSSGLDLQTPSNAGSRLGLNSLETPASIDVIEGQTIRQRGQRDVNQAVVQNAVGIAFLGSPGNGGTSFSMRGFTGQTSITRLYDGTRLYAGSGTVTFPFVSWNIDRIEVLHGPASVLYGEGGAGGAINFVPKKPLTDSTRNEMRTTIGTDGRMGLAYGIAGPLNERLAYSFDISRTTSDGWLDGNDTSSLAISGALRWQATDNLALTLSHDDSDNRPGTYFGTPLVNGTLDESVRFNNYNVTDDVVRFQDRFTQLKAEWTPNNNVTVKSNTYYLTSDRDWRNVEYYTYDPLTSTVDREFYIAINHGLEQIGNRTDVAFSNTFGGMKNTTTVGFDVNRIKFTNTNNSPYAGTSTVGFANPIGGVFGDYTLNTSTDTTTDQFAVFADNSLKFSDKLSLVGGFRYDHLSVSRVDPEFTRDFESLSWRLGAVYKPVSNVAFYGQYSRAAEPIGYALSLADSQKDLNLTKVTQQEVGVKLDLMDGRAQATLSAYKIVKNDLLARDESDPTITRQIGQQSAKGIEAAFGMAVTPDLRIDVNGALVSAKYDDYIQSETSDYTGNRPSNTPQRVANIWTSWNFAKNWTGRLGAHYVSETFTNSANTTTRPSYVVLNAGLEWQPRDNMTLNLNVYNLTDRVYATSGGSTQWKLGAPRTATVDLSVKF